ncbi:hypothetical protein [Nocardioides sp.]|uniref:hypothetical protein n=1 Tax=Nocardioides sp. TaxID=35761 RepID=UPI002ECFEE11
MSRWSDRTLRRLAWASWWVTAATAVLGVVVTSIGNAEAATSWGGGGPLAEYAFVIVVLVFPLVGLGVLVRQPRNRIGWLLQAVGLSWSLPSLVDTYAHYGLVIAPGSVPGATVAAAVNEGTWTWGIITMGVFLILLFPDGHLLSPRWRIVAWLAVFAAVVTPVSIMLAPGTLEEAPVTGITNPLSAGALEPVVIALNTVALPLVPICIAAAAVSLALRFRRSSGVQRQQIKWLAAAGSVVAALFGVTLLTTLVAEVATGGTPGLLPLPVRLLQEASILSFLLLPLAIGVAILRHGLFDIDLVINRALVYGSLTATLAVVYLGSVLLLQLVLRPLTSESDLAVAVSTLAVAALFRPARGRIQRLVDRRFYRRRYDAAQTLDAFTGRLRHEVDVDAVGADLLAAVHETVQPRHASIWLSNARQAS